MKLKVFDLPLDESSGRFDDEELAKFLEDKEGLSFSEHFFMHEHRPRLVVLVSYREQGGEKSIPTRSSGSSKKDWRTTLSPEEAVVYDRLRAWRRGRAAEEGVPPYLIFGNEQMAEISRKQPSSLTELGKVTGIGKSTCDRYGEGILTCIRSVQEPKVEEPTTTQEPSKKEGENPS